MFASEKLLGYEVSVEHLTKMEVEVIQSYLTEIALKFQNIFPG